MGLHLVSSNISHEPEAVQDICASGRDYTGRSESVDFLFQISLGEAFMFTDRLNDCPDSDTGQYV